jgi:hypothetical protein
LYERNPLAVFGLISMCRKPSRCANAAGTDIEIYLFFGGLRQDIVPGKENRSVGTFGYCLRSPENGDLNLIGFCVTPDSV